ncbi:MAG: ABC transporter permease [bacterium]|nr:ABC transporter permease [bacterium]
MLAAVGIALGVGSLYLFLTIGSGLSDAFRSSAPSQSGRVEVVPKPVDLQLGMFRLGVGGESIDERMLADLARVPGVQKVSAKVRLVIPAMMTAGAEWIGSDFSFDIVAEGVPSELVAGDVGEGFSFSVFPHSPEHDLDHPCKQDSDCEDNHYCRNEAFKAGFCRAYVPVLAPKDFVGLYNDFLSKAHGYPRLDEEMLLGTVAELEVGRSILGGGRARGLRQTERARLVGFSSDLPSLALAMPTEFVARMNATTRGAAALTEFHSAVLDLTLGADVASIREAIEAMDLEFRGNAAERAAQMINTGTAVLVSASVAVLTVATIHVMHVFMLLVLQRRQQIAVMRAVGASRIDVMVTVALEAILVGVISGGFAVIVAIGMTRLLVRSTSHLLHEFSYLSGSSVFSPNLRWAFTCIAVATLCCVAGAVLGAARTVTKDPAVLLKG